MKGQKGFTLMELMIVIAIIGILTAIAVPNFMSYRNRSYCTRAEADANTIALAIAEYYADPSNTALPTLGDLNNGNGLDLSGSGAENAVTITAANDDDANDANPNDISAGIDIQVTDSSGLCPADYQDGKAEWTDNVFTITIFD